MIRNLQNQHSFFLVNMKAWQLHLPHTCLANCRSGHHASRGGVWELTEARIGIPALCWVEQGVSGLSRAVPVRVVIELKLEHCTPHLGLRGHLDTAPRPWSYFANSRPSAGGGTGLT